MKFLSSLVVLLFFSTLLAEAAEAFEPTKSNDRSDDAVVQHQTTSSIVLPRSKRASQSPTSSSLPLYYIHHVVSLTSNPTTYSKILPVNLPKQGDYPEVPQEDWAEFWASKIRPLAAKIDRSSILHRNIGWLANTVWAFALVHLFKTVGTWKQNKENVNAIARMNSASLWHLGFFVAMIVAKIARHAWIFKARKNQLDSFMNLCQQEGEPLLQQHGYTVECSCDVLEHFGGLRQSHAFSLDFYRIPADTAPAEEKSYENDDDIHSNGPLSIKLCNLGSSVHSSVSIINMPVLQTHIPTIKFSEDTQLHGLWSSFWNEMKATSNQVWERHQWAKHVNYGLLFMLTFHGMLRRVARSVWSKVNIQFLSEYCLKLAASRSLQIIPIDLLLYLVGFIFTAYGYSNVLNAQRNLVERYAPEFAKYNVLLQHRRKATFGRSNDYADYLYLIPSMGNGSS